MITEGIEKAIKHVLQETYYLSQGGGAIEIDIVRDAYAQIEPLVDAEAKNRVLAAKPKPTQAITLNIFQNDDRSENEA